jgi:hypothetical protein
MVSRAGVVPFCKNGPGLSPEFLFHGICTVVNPPRGAFRGGGRSSQFSELLRPGKKFSKKISEKIFGFSKKISWKTIKHHAPDSLSGSFIA